MPSTLGYASNGPERKSAVEEIEEKVRQLNSRDPWMHRAGKMLCQTCMWCCPKANIGEVTCIGRCRRHAPTISGYPVVYLSDWCGDHKLDETKA
jgi:hypothetical protein